MFERFSKLARARLHLVEQSYVLDSNHRLIGKGGRELDLLVVERPHATTHQADDADGNPFAQQRDAQQGAKALTFLDVCPGVFRVVFYIGDLDAFAFKQGASHDSSSITLNRMILEEFNEFI